jgi:cysteine synthase A
MSGAISKAIKLQKTIKNSFLPQQFENINNPKKHEKTTALEILKDTNGKVDIFVASVGTGGTITGVGRILKQHNTKIKIVAVEPSSSAVISGEKSGLHKIQGIGAGFIPKILDKTIIDEIIKVHDKDAFKTSRKIARKEGLFVGISSGANLWASKQIAKREENKQKTIVTILCDTGERYLSSELFETD